jgi:hypothetical protein
MKLININEIAPSTYNPRVADPERLDLIELSLRKLGFLLPLYATPDGEIISGHQRHHVACRMGVSQVPLAITRPMDLAERKGVNVVFNRATNDLGQSDTVEKINDQLKAADVRKLAEAIPDKEVDSPEFFPCLNAKPHAIAPFLKANQGRWKNYALNLAKTLKRRGIVMPIVATRDYRVVNGIGRLQQFAETGKEQIPVVFVSDAEGQLAEAMLNYLSMDFDIHRRYEDLLRHNSFRRLHQVRKNLGRGFIFAVAGDTPNDTYLERARLIKAQADKTELEVATLKSELVLVDAVESDWLNHVSACRSRLLAIPSKSAFQIATLKEPDEIERFLKRTIYEALAELSRDDDEIPDTPEKTTKRMDSTAGTNRKPVGGRKPKTKPGSKRRTRKVED